MTPFTPPGPELFAGWDRNVPRLVGVSGGVDSITLLHLLREAGFDALTVCHCHHGLRGDEAGADEAFVREMAESLDYPFTVGRVDTREFAVRERLSLETAARTLRYRFFAEVARSAGCREVLLAHQADDQVETVLIHLFRGTGLRGLAGMEESTTREVDRISLTIRRPLLGVTRESLEKWAAARGISWREDSSNTDSFALRNRVRHRLLPAIEEVFGRDVRASVVRLSQIARLEEAASRETVERTLRGLEIANDGRVTLSVAGIRGLTEAERNRTLLAWLRKSEVPDCGYAEALATGALALRDGPPAKVNLPGGVHARRRAGALFLEFPELVA